MRYLLSWGVDDTLEGTKEFGTIIGAEIYASVYLNMTATEIRMLCEQGQHTTEIGGGCTEWVRFYELTEITLVRGLLYSADDKRFANSSPVWTGITARILQGFKGTHPNA